MDLWKKPPSFFGKSVSTSLEESESRDLVMQTPLRETKIPPFKTHRLSSHTESTEKGLLSSNQIDRLKGLLKDAPNRHWMRGFEVPNIPLSVIERDEENEQKGFHPGSLEGHSWYLEKNRIPIMDRERDKFVQKHGKDFSLHYSTHSSLCKRPIFPLTDEERENHLFHPVKESLETTS